MTAATERCVLVLAGGRGERFWPWSRPERPKQLLPLASDGRTLLRATLDRALRVVPAERILVLTARDLVAAIRGECPAGVEVLGEPVARNTAPAIGAAAVRFGPRACFAVMPSDHLIGQVDAFAGDLERAFATAEREPVLVTFGVPPAGPETNFGYLRRGASIGERIYRVAEFCEKPDRARAEAYLRQGGYAWNAGIFVWRTTVFLDALEAARPALAAPLRAMRYDDGPGFEAALERVFPGLEAISVDYAVLERAPNVLMLEASFDWDDLGSWSAWARRQPHDSRGNVVFGNVEAIDCDGCILVSEDEAPTAVMGLRDLIVVQSQGGTLVCRRESSDQVRRVVEALRARRSP
jgi:mannose-1-phosphate guanylyltransferase